MLGAGASSTAAAAAKNYAGYALHRNSSTRSQPYAAPQWHGYYYDPVQWSAPQVSPSAEPPVPEGPALPPAPQAGSVPKVSSVNPQDFYRGTRLRAAAPSAIVSASLPSLPTLPKLPAVRPIDADFEEPFVYYPTAPLSATVSTIAATVATSLQQPVAHPLHQMSAGTTLLPPGVGMSQPIEDASSGFNLHALTSLLQKCAPPTEEKTLSPRH